MNPLDKLRKTDPDKAVKLQRYELKIYIKRLLDDNECLFSGKKPSPTPTIYINTNSNVKSRNTKFFIEHKIGKLNEQILERKIKSYAKN